MFRIGLVVLSLGFFASAADGGAPTQINHQGVVSVNGQRFTGDGSFYFAIVDPSNGDGVWTNDGTNIGTSNRPSQPVTLPCANGLYNVRLGDTSLPNMTPVTADVFSAENRALRIWFDDATNGVFQLTPDHPLTSVPYAFRAAGVGTGIPITRVYTANDTWTKSSGLKYIEVEVVGGGGGGGGSSTNGVRSAGGGGGGYSRMTIAASSLNATETTTVGVGGGGGSETAGTAGGTSSFGAYLSATGGSGGESNQGGGGFGYVGGNGGVGIGGDINVGGQGGGGSSPGGGGPSGTGGSSVLGGGGAGQGGFSDGQAGRSFGGGGSGALSGGSPVQGGAGAPGVVIVKEYF